METWKVILLSESPWWQGFTLFVLIAAWMEIRDLRQQILDMKSRK